MDDFERLAIAAYLVGKDAESNDLWARTSRLIDEEGLDCVVASYVPIPAALQNLGRGDHAAA